MPMAVCRDGVRSLQPSSVRNAALSSVKSEQDRLIGGLKRESERPRGMDGRFIGRACRMNSDYLLLSI